MKTMKIYGTDFEVKANNQREVHLLEIANMKLETMSKEYCYDHMIADLQGLFSAMFFLKMTSEPMTITGWDKCLYVCYKDQRISLPKAAAA